MQLTKLTLTLLLGVITLMGTKAQNFGDHRYMEPVFDEIEHLTDVTYTTAPQLNAPYFDESNSVNTEFQMDIFLPANDDLQYRPAVIFCHSGAFATGNRHHDDMMAFCDSLARRGFVTATIDYRQGFNALDTNSSIRAVFRGLQEARSAVRFLRAHSEEYGIDKDRVYIAGSSAGGFMALHAIYMNDESEVPPSTEAYTYQAGFPPQTYSAPDMGGLDIGEYLEEDGEPNAAINMWGAIQSPEIITETDDSPVILIHGTSDPTVPFEVGSPFGFPLFPPSYGSAPISERLSDMNFDHETYFVEGAGHEFYGTDNGDFPASGPNEYWDTVYNKVNSFLWKLDKPLANFDYDTNALQVDFVFLCEEADDWQWDFGDGNTSQEMNPTHIYSQMGQYTVTLEVLNEMQSWDTAVQTINVGFDAIESPEKTSIRVYPNPVKEFFIIEGTQISKVELFNLSGNLVFKTILNGENRVKIDLNEDLNPGVYFCKVWMEDGKRNDIHMIKL